MKCKFLMIGGDHNGKAYYESYIYANDLYKDYVPYNCAISKRFLKPTRVWVSRDLLNITEEVDTSPNSFGKAGITRLA